MAELVSMLTGPVSISRVTDQHWLKDYEDRQGQFTFDNDGELIRGVWYVARDEADECLVVGGDRRTRTSDADTSLEET